MGFLRELQEGALGTPDPESAEVMPADRPMPSGSLPVAEANPDSLLRGDRGGEAVEIAIDGLLRLPAITVLHPVGGTIA